ncbi:MAG: DUF4388 domain-containing protein [Anaerolineales bacterium]
MKGKLNEISPSDLIQQFCLEKRTARLMFQYQKNFAEVFIREGNLVHAQLGKQQGESVIRQILKWNDGTFETQEGKQSPNKSINQFWLNILLEENINDNVSASNLLTQNTLHTTEVAREEFTLELFLQEISVQLSGYLGSAVINQKGEILAHHEIRKLYINEALPYITQFVKILPAIIEKSELGQVEEDLFTTENAYCLIRFIPLQQVFLLIIADRSMRGVGNLLFFSRTIADKISELSSTALSPKKILTCFYQEFCPVYQRKVQLSDSHWGKIKEQYCQAEFKICPVFELLKDIRDAGLPINMYYREIQALVNPK